MRSSSVLGLVSIALGLCTPSIGLAQLHNDNTSPPIDVPTTPVPQGTSAPPPKPAAKPPPKPAPAPPPATPKAAPAAPPAEPKKDTGDATTPKYNNEGVFKISGSKGSGVVGAPKPKTEKAPAATTTGKTAATKGKKAPSPNVAQWPGFRLTEDGGSEVMVEFSSSPASPTEHRAAGSITYAFKGAHVTKSNNQNPLMTVHFNTPILSARLVPKKGELHLVIDMRPGANAPPTSGLRASTDGDGQQFFVKFPAGTWLPKGAENEEIGPAPTQKLKNKPDKTDKKPDTPPPTTAPKTESGGKTGPAP